MNYTLTISPGSLEAMQSAVEAKFEALKLPVQLEMASAMYGIVINNFGSSGPMRPFDWQPLSKDYARKVGRTFATLYVTGALKGTINVDASPDAGVVSMANNGMVPYALAHHHGNPGNFGWTEEGSGDLPSRRVFPLEPFADEVTSEAVEVVREAAMAEVGRRFVR